MTPESVLLIKDAALLLLVVFVVWRVTNSTGTISWQIRTTEPETSRLRVERDEARTMAERLRAEIEGRS
jgi:hypothetical protein